MRSYLIATVAALTMFSSAAQARDAAIAAPIKQIMDGFNTGNIAAVKAVHTASPTIIDNVAPFIWSGSNAFDTWLVDLGKAEASEGKTNGSVVFGASVSELVAGDRAFVVSPCSYTYTQGGKRVREQGYTSFVLVKEAGSWKVSSWAWSSPDGVPVK